MHDGNDPKIQKKLPKSSFTFMPHWAKISEKVVSEDFFWRWHFVKYFEFATKWEREKEIEKERKRKKEREREKERNRGREGKKN